MEQAINTMPVVRSFPISYLIVPIHLIQNQGDDSFYVDYAKNCINEKKDHWKPSEIQNGYFRYITHFDYVNQFFHAFEGTTSVSTNMENCFVLELKDKTKYNTQHHYYFPNGEDDKSSIINFSFLCREKSIDSIRLVVCSATNTATLIMPIRPDEGNVTIDEYQDFLYQMRYTYVKCIHTIEDKGKAWSLDEKIKELLSDFGGQYQRMTPGLAHHLTFIAFDKDVIKNEYDKILQGITRCKRRSQMGCYQPCRMLRISDDVVIGSSLEGTTILTAQKLASDSTENNDIKKEYAVQQIERIVLYFIVVLQRYTLLDVIFQLQNPNNTSDGFFTLLRSKIANAYWKVANRLLGIRRPHAIPLDKQRLKKLRNAIGVICQTKVNNSFSCVSDISEVNTYYRLCSDALGLKYLYAEIDNKVDVLDSYLTQISDENKERADWHLSIILAILTVMSASNDGIQIIDRINQPDYKYPWLYIAGLIVAIFFVAYLIYTVVKTRR